MSAGTARHSARAAYSGRRARDRGQGAYGLTVDRRERDAPARTLAGCEDTEIDIIAPGAAAEIAAPSPPAAIGTDALALYDDNGNGRITCAEARRHGIAPVPRSHPAYRYMRDGDGDGVVCE